METKKAKTIEEAACEYLAGLQQIQMTNPPTSLAWIRASKEIQALCHTMAERKRRGQ